MLSFANDKFVDNTETILSYLTNKDVENTPAETNIVREKMSIPTTTVQYTVDVWVKDKVYDHSYMMYLFWLYKNNLPIVNFTVRKLKGKMYEIRRTDTGVLVAQITAIPKK